MNPLKPPCAPAKLVWKLCHATMRTGEAEAGDDDDQHHFEPGEEELEVSRFLDAEVVEPGDEPAGEDGEDLRPGDQEWSLQTTPSSQAKAAKIPITRARPVVTLAMDAGLATANHVHM